MVRSAAIESAAITFFTGTSKRDQCMSSSIHDKLKRVRPPRVHITYEVETEGAVVLKELPFRMGVMGNFSGNPTTALPPLKERKFTNIDRDNFNEVMRRIAPELNIRVKNTLQEGDTEMPIQLKFNSLDDFRPAQVAQQVKPLKDLMDTRDKLRDLLTKVDRSDKLENLLEQVLQNTDDLKKLSSELNTEGPGKPG